MPINSMLSRRALLLAAAAPTSLATFQDHLPSGDEPAKIVLIDAASRQLMPIAETRAWNLQQCAMLHWNPLRPEDEILFNDRIGEDLVTVVLNVQNGKRRILPMALAGVSYNGRHARLRPVVGIRGVPDHSTPGNHPEDDGAFLMDLETGKTKIVLSVAETYRHLKDKHPELGELPMFFNRTCFSKDDKR